MKLSKKLSSFLGEFDLALAFAIAVLICLSTNSAFAQSSSSYQTAQTPVPVQMGVVLQVRDVVLDASASSKTVGGVVGGAFGALLAARAAQNGNSNSFVLTSALTSIGALGGALMANKVATTKSQEIVYVQDDGKAFAVTQSSDDGVIFFAGQKVFILNGRIAPVAN